MSVLLQATLLSSAARFCASTAESGDGADGVSCQTAAASCQSASAASSTRPRAAALLPGAAALLPGGTALLT
eukprot:13771510-Alexandrium_andersonii.AAC.1